ncbi:MAG TPA: hypothetical protein VHC22_24965 [Pirellulales bacterium]|nr:hypothetical protein [Pirellulales bacterium]
MAGRFQFSIRFLLLATVAVAASVAAFRLEPSLVAISALDSVTLFFATTAIVGVRQTVGWVQAFWIGAAFVLVLSAIFVAMDASQSHPFLIPSDAFSPKNWGARLVENHRLSLAACWCAAPINGLLAVFLHRLFRPRKPPAGP